MLQDVVPGDYDLEIEYGEFEIRKRFVIKPTDLDQSIDFKIPTGKATARVTLLNQDGKPSRSTVRLWSADGVASMRMQTKDDDNGQPYHEAANLADGKYVVLSYFRPFGGPSIAELEIVDGKDTTVTRKIPANPAAPDTIFQFTVFDEQSVYMRTKIEVVSEQKMDVRQGEFGYQTRLIVPRGSTFKARINLPGFELYEQEIQSTEKPKSFTVVLKRKQ